MSGSGRSQELEYLFPNLAVSGYEITGEASDQYNCIAWALGITAEKWNSEDPADYWPPSLPRNNRVETVMRLFAAEGFSLCDDDTPELGYEKIAVYALSAVPITWRGRCRMAGGPASWEDGSS